MSDNDDRPKLRLVQPGEDSAEAAQAAVNAELDRIVAAKDAEALNAELDGLAFNEAETITWAASLNQLRYDQCRKFIAKRLNCRTDVLDRVVAERRPGGDRRRGSPTKFRIIEPSAAALSGETLLTLVSKAIRKHVVITEAQADAIALWILHAWCINAADHSPFLVLLSPEAGSGKTTLLKVLLRFTPKAKLSSSITGPAVFRFIDEHHPTLLIDEADAFLPEKEELRGVLDSGHDREGATVTRLVGDNHELREFSTWCPKAIAMMGKTPHPTLVGRSIVIEMQRYAPGERPARLDNKAKEYLSSLASMVARWALDHVDALKDADPEVPDLRDGDNWRPLLAIADAATNEPGSDPDRADKWSNRARAAMVELLGADRGQNSVKVELLEDIYRLFEMREVDRLTSAEIVEALARMEGKPWPEWKAGKPITTTQLARLLKPFKIAPATIRTAIGTAKGYMLEWFSEAWKRYLPPPQLPSRAVTPSQPQSTGVSEQFEPSQAETDVTDQIGRKAAETSHSYGVTGRNPPRAGEEVSDDDIAFIENELGH